jgi:two-component system nitrogen regulation sensor histidine kinase GlnL
MIGSSLITARTPERERSSNAPAIGGGWGGLGGAIDAATLLNALPNPLLLIDADNHIAEVNLAAENFFEASASHLRRTTLREHMPADSTLISLVDQVRRKGGSVSEEGITLAGPRFGPHLVALQVASITDAPGSVVVTINPRMIASKIERQLTHRHAARSVTAMSEMLAHEVKNPLSGIRGAAQLMEQNASDDDRLLTKLIIDEVDRIVALVDRIGVFSDGRPMAHGPVNIHQVMEHVRRIAQSGFGRRIRFIERYDPSLPPTIGNRDQLVQVFLNLVKNAAEAISHDDGEITLTTSYQHGVRLAVPNSDQRVHLPLVVSVQDNGDGIPDDLSESLFEAFVTTKQNGTGLGLALVAKIIGDHGGVVEFDGQPGRTIFRVRLPLFLEGEEQ